VRSFILRHKEVVGAGNPDQLFGLAGEGDCGLDVGNGAVLISRAADEELGLGAIAQEAEVVVAAFGVDGKPESDEARNARIAAADLEADPGAEGESGEEDGAMELAVEPVDGGTNVVLLAAAVIVGALAEARAAEVEAKDGETEGLEGLHGVVNDLVVQGASAQRVRMADEGGKGRVGRAGVEQSFKAAGGGAEIVDGAERSGAGVRHRLQGTGYEQQGAHPVHWGLHDTRSDCIDAAPGGC
jgi:hypothetical protein